MKTDIYFNRAGETFNRARLEGEMARAIKALGGLTAWCAFHARPITHPEEMAAARLAAHGAALQGALDQAKEISVEASVEALENGLTRLTRIDYTGNALGQRQREGLRAASSAWRIQGAGVATDGLKTASGEFGERYPGFSRHD